MEHISSTLSKLSPFATTSTPNDEDVGEVTDGKTLAGGGHAGRDTATTDRLRVHPALKDLLISKGAVATENEVQALVQQPHVLVPPELTDRSHKLPDYFVSSSHNTYLLAHQLYGNSSAQAYEEHLVAGARCVEIDAWDGEDADEPKVTHGWTLTSDISFRAVCETIRDVVDLEASHSKDEQGYRTAPILISLENHCGPRGQQRMVDIMHELWGDRLLSKAVREKGAREKDGVGEHVTLAELGSKIVVIVEYLFPTELERRQSSLGPDHDLADKERQEYERKKKEAAPSAVIIPSLADIGVYAQSVKPPNNDWFEQGVLQDSPHHPLINVSETALSSHMPQYAQAIAQHNSNHLMRVYPKGTRISSANLNPVPYWAVGAQICALNWQTFGASMQLNEAMFTGTDGYVLKPAYLRHCSFHENRRIEPRQKRLRLHVAGATDVPIPADRPQDGSDSKPYLTCTLFDPSLTSPPSKRKTSVYKQHRFTGPFHRSNNPGNTDPIWDETLEWEYEDSELAFLRMLIKSDDAFAANPKFAVCCVRLLYVRVDQWVFIRLLNLKGQETGCSLLVKFEITDA